MYRIVATLLNSIIPKRGVVGIIIYIQYTLHYNCFYFVPYFEMFNHSVQSFFHESPLFKLQFLVLICSTNTEHKRCHDITCCINSMYVVPCLTAIVYSSKSADCLNMMIPLSSIIRSSLRIFYHITTKCMHMIQ